MRCPFAVSVRGVRAWRGVNDGSDRKWEMAMNVQWDYQLRIYLNDEFAEVARQNPDNGALKPLADILNTHRATMKCQFDAFSDYVGEAERQGTLIVNRCQSLGVRTVSRFFNVVELPNPVEGLVKRGTGGIVFKGRWNIRIRDLVAVGRFFVVPQNSRIFPVIGSIYWSRILRAAQDHERNKQHDQKKYINDMT